MRGFLGRYEYQLDEKGRVSLPSAFRREAGGDRFVLLQWQKPSLTLFDQESEAWQSVQRKLVEFRKSGEEGWAYFRQITSNAVELSPDKQGRILIPGWLQEAASLDGSVLVIGALDRIELWNPVEFRNHVVPDAVDVSRFAPQIFG